ncbi:glycosyltransferase [Nonomuraea sp. NPDC048826]|uniref:glycosyltransferase n=1 Tax=Nonomuraea sp. NPDC048826 TaxID=3364347 RepID=UPI0037182EF4
MDADLDYVLPLRWEDDAGLDELTAYLSWLSRRARVIVVDGSPAVVFARHARRWRGLAVHVPPDPGLRYANGKVNGVVTGLRLATADRVVIADDDVRYDDAGLAGMRRLLDGHDLVRPQNHFRPLPWHARWDTARTLLNRAFGADYPGTLGVRRACVADGYDGYDGDVLFENLELIRTVRARGGRVVSAPGLYVRRLPCTAERFWSQRVRQAYDDLAQPARLALSLSVLPAVAAAVARRAYRPLLAGAGLAVLVAEAGRRRAGGRAVFPAGASLFAPVWILERGVCGWLALGAAVTGGVPYAGRRLRRAAHSTRWLRRHGPARSSGAGGAVAVPGAAGAARGAEPGRLV